MDENTSPQFSVPAYLLAASVHDTARGQRETGFLDSAVDLLTKGVPTALIAAGNEIANIPSTLGNWLSGDDGRYEITSNKDAIAAFDADWEKYYEEHQLGIDTAGFIAASFVPGGVGVKATRMAPTVLETVFGASKMGRLSADSIGLLAGTRQKHLEAAMEQIAKTGNPFKYTETNLLKAFAAGVGTNAIEGAAATAAINATMYNSPILDDRDMKDLMWDVVLGAGIGGAVGGLFSGVKAAGAVKKAANVAEAEVQPWTIAGLDGMPAESLSTSDKIIFKLRQLDSIPEIDPAFHLAERAGRVAAKTKQTLETEIRALTGELAGGDQEVATLLAQQMQSTGLTKNAANLFNSENIIRVGAKSKAEKAADAAAAKIAKQKLDPLNLPEEIASALNKAKVSYVSLLTGNTVDRPAILNLADIGTPEIVRGGVKAGGKVFAVNAKNQFNPYKMGHLESEAHYLHAEQAAKFPEGKVPEIGIDNIPLLQKAVRENRIAKVGANEYSPAELQTLIKARQSEIAAVLVKEGKRTPAEIAKIVNASEDALFRGRDGESLWNLRDMYREAVKANGYNVKDAMMLPSHLKVVTSTEGLLDKNGMAVDAFVAIEQKQKIYRQNAREIAAAGLGEILPESAGLKGLPIGQTTGSGFLTAEGGNYGTLSSFFAYVGQRTSAAIKRAHDATDEVFNPLLYKLRTDTNAAIEWSVLNEKMRNLPQAYVLAEDGASLIHRKLAQAIADGVEPNLDELGDLAVEIPIKSQTVRELVAQHIVKNDSRRGHVNKIHNNNGYMDRFEAGTFYPIPRNPKDTPHFAFVVDKSVNGRGHSQMIYAKDGETLEQMKNSILSDPDLQKMNLKVLTKQEAEEYYKSVGQFEFERTLSENYIQTALARKGKSASYLPLTDPSRIADDFINWHKGRDSALVRSLVEHNYAEDFATLRATAAPALEASKSKFGYVSAQAFAENSVNNPAANLIKLALNVSKVDEYPLWSPLNKFLDEGFSKLSETIGRVFSKATDEKHLAEINTALKEAGYTNGNVDAALYEAMNGKVPRGKLTKIVNHANALIATLALRSDPFNALNNAVGHSVLLGPELKAVISAIEAGNKEAVGKLAEIAKIAVPGTGDKIFSPAKLVANRITKFHTDVAGREWMKQHGFSTRITEQYDQSLDLMAKAIASGDESYITKAMNAMKGLGDAAEKWTGNKFAEEFNRYVAAGVMKDITDVAVDAGVMSQREALSYINTFVNRTQGNYLASQRPAVFQGPVGQAIGLFQTYQFNLLQQLFRYVGEGTAKNAAVMMGMQAGIYGLNGLPAFNAMNTYIIGAAGGNTEHKNLYDAIMSGAGKEAGEWLTYGMASNMFSLFHPDLKTNIYTRGDLNPRQITLLPVYPSKTPIWQVLERTYGNLKQSYQQVAMGADVWGTVLSGIEQNGISRPLAGMAMVLSGAASETGLVRSTNQQGNLLMVHDWKSLTSLMRIAGAKPLDEAMMNDTMFRINAYRTADMAKREQLGEAIKNSIRNGALPDQEQITQFAESYAATGGKVEEFNSFWTRQYKNIHQSQADLLRQKLKDPYHQRLSILMGGES